MNDRTPPPIDFAGLRTATHKRYSGGPLQRSYPPTPTGRRPGTVSPDQCGASTKSPGKARADAVRGVGDYLSGLTGSCQGSPRRPQASSSGECSGWPSAAADQAPPRSARRGAAVSPAIPQQAARKPTRCRCTHIAAARRCGFIYRLDSLTDKRGPLACFGRRRAVPFACCPKSRWRHWRHWRQTT